MTGGQDLEVVRPKLARSGITRRDVIVKGAVAGGLVWAAPTIISSPAWAAEGGGGTPRCQPVVSVTCTRVYCCQGQKFFPGVRISIGPCRCDEATTPRLPSACVKLGQVEGQGQCASSAFVFYGEGTYCSPNPAYERIIEPGDWACIIDNPCDGTPGVFDYEIFIGQERNANGAIDEIGDDCTMAFDLGVWAGGCPTDADPTGGGELSAYECLSYRVQVTWQQNTIPGVCQGGYVSFCDIAPATTSLCADVGTTSPCDQSECPEIDPDDCVQCTAGPNTESADACGDTF